MAELSGPPGGGGFEEGRSADGAIPDGLAREIARAVRGLRYGSIEITVHDGTVVQIERKEKIRVGREGSRPKR